MNETAIALVEGPQGKAEIVEVINQTTRSPEYQVRFAGGNETFKTMGEAYITAKEKAGVKA